MRNVFCAGEISRILNEYLCLTQEKNRQCVGKKKEFGEGWAEGVCAWFSRDVDP